MWLGRPQFGRFWATKTSTVFWTVSGIAPLAACATAPAVSTAALAASTAAIWAHDIPPAQPTMASRLWISQMGRVRCLDRVRRMYASARPEGPEQNLQDLRRVRIARSV